MNQIIFILYSFFIFFLGVLRFNRAKRNNFQEEQFKEKSFKTIEFFYWIINVLVLIIIYIKLDIRIKGNSIIFSNLIIINVVIYTVFEIYIQYRRYKNKKSFFWKIIIPIIVLVQLLFTSKDLIDDSYILYKSFPEKNIKMYLKEDEYKSMKRYSVLLKLEDKEYDYHWHVYGDRDPLINLKLINNVKEKLLITFEKNEGKEIIKLYSTIDLKTKKRTDRYANELIFKIDDKQLAFDEYERKDLKIHSSDKVEGEYLDKIKDFDYFILKNRNNENFLVRTEFGRVDDFIKLSEDSKYTDFKLSKYSVYIAINFVKNQKGNTNNSIEIIELQDNDYTKLLRGQMKKELVVGGFDYPILDYKFEDNFKIIITKYDNKEIEEFELNPTKTQMDDKEEI